MKKGLPKAQKGLAKLARIVKTASKTAGNTTKGAKPVVRKAKRIGNAAFLAPEIITSPFNWQPP